MSNSDPSALLAAKTAPDAVADGVSPLAEVTAELSAFVREVTAQKAEMKSRLKQQEERLLMLDRKSTSYARPALSGAVAEAAPHQKAFDAYLRSGDDDALRGLELDGKAMSTAVSGEGGYLVDPQTSETVKNVLKSQASLRAVAQVVTVEATSYEDRKSVV